MKISGINHLTFSVSDLEKSIHFYQHVLGGKLLVKGRNLAYFDLNGIWVALNVQQDIRREDIHHSYTHIAFSVCEEEFDLFVEKFEELGVNILSGRKRDEREKRSIYFTDPDGHKFELHTGSLQDRMSYYKSEKPYMEFYNE